MTTFAAHIRLARFDHWVKIAFALPGIAVAYALDRQQLGDIRWASLFLGLVAIGLVASSNYVLNDLLDAPFDRIHPIKRNYPVAAGLVNIPLAWAECLVFLVAGLAIGVAISAPVAWCLAGLWVAGLLYNAPPFRLKDTPYLDVLTESANNPLRFVAGWYLTGSHALPVTSLVISYWMAGAYLMAIKRYAELRDIRTRETLVQYRKSFGRVTEQSLLASICFYGSLSMLFFGAFMGRYRLEMALAFPLVAFVMSTYMALAFKPDSAAQRPEGLLREPWLIAGVVLSALVIGILLFADVPWLHEIFKPTAP